MSQLFISDLHLDPAQPAITARFEQLLRDEIGGVESLYVLGDLFEAWLGDDAADDPLSARVAKGLSDLARGGTRVYFLHGNRDFLVGQEFASRCAMRILPDPCVVDLYGTSTLLLHGDTLCTDDTAYQAFRGRVRNRTWQGQFLAQSIAQRRAFAQQARAASRQHQAGLDSAITDVNPLQVERMFERFGVHRMIHGHTHRPAIHRYEGKRDGGNLRIVLGDWYEQGSSLRVSPEGIELRSF